VRKRNGVLRAGTISLIQKKSGTAERMTAGAIPLFFARHAAGKKVIRRMENCFSITICDDSNPLLMGGDHFPFFLYPHNRIVVLP
jgi:hypothetical protein